MTEVIHKRTLQSEPRFEAWLGRSEEVWDPLDPWRAQALAGALGLQCGASGPGDELLPGWHWVYFLEAPSHADLGADGHRKRGEFLPPVELPGRMWVSGRIRLHTLPRLGSPACRVSRITNVAEKTGRSGPLVFVTVRHEICANGKAGICEDQVIAYRTRPSGNSSRPRGSSRKEVPGFRREWRVDERMLFRYSALLYNAHRIHYDIDYCRKTEGYPGLVVHGPLLATALLDLALVASGENDAGIREFAYRAWSPVFHTEAFAACGRAGDGGLDLWIEGADGSVRMTARASWNESE